MKDSVKNFAKTTLAAGITSGATSCTVASGTGGRFPAAPFNATIWNQTDHTSPDDAFHAGAGEIVRVTSVATDTLTITRAQEGTSAVAHNTSGKTYGIIAGVTAKTMDEDVYSLVPTAVSGSSINTARKILNTLSVTGNVTLTFSATPETGGRFQLRISADATDRVITIPSSYSLARGAAITSFTLAANTTVYLQWEYTGSVYNLVGDPLTAAQAAVGRIETLSYAFSNESDAITTGTAKVTFHMAFGFKLLDVWVGLSTPQTSGSIFTVDLNEAGTSVLSTKITVDNTEDTSKTAAAQPVISDTTLAQYAKMTVDVDQVGDGTAKGGKIYLEGVRT